MYLQTWQIFAGGCVCGAFITVLIILAFIIRLATVKGVVVRHEREEKEDKDNG